MRLDPFDVRGNAGFLANARRTLLPLPIVDRPDVPPRDVLPPFEPRPAPGLAGKRVGVSATAAGAESVALVGMARAFEEADLRPAAIEAAAESAIWGAMWAGGVSADEMAQRALAWRPQDVLDVQWAGTPRLAIAALRGFAGLATGRALEQLFDRGLWHMTAGRTEIDFHVLARHLDGGATERLGTTTTPDLTLGELVRIAAARPRRSAAVRVEGRFYVGARATAAPPHDRGLDHVFGPPLESGGDGFYGVFLDRRRWPDLIRAGHSATAEKLARYA
jgi:hypothetical protein